MNDLSFGMLDEAAPKLGCPENWAFLPFLKEMKRHSNKLEITEGDSLSLSSLLESKSLNCAFLPSIDLYNNEDLEMALPLGLSSGIGWTAFWGIKEDSSKLSAYIERRFEELSLLAVDSGVVKSASKASIKSFMDRAVSPSQTLKSLPYMRYDHLSGSFKVLAKLSYLLVFGKDAYTANDAMQGSAGTSSESSIDVKMGRDALIKKCSYPKVFDLCSCFEQITSFPFVSMVLQKYRKEKLGISKQLVMEAVDISHRKMTLEPSSYLPDQLPTNSNGCSIDLSAVWKTTSYKLSNDELKGLLAFLSMAKYIDKRAVEDDVLSLNILRCQKKGEELLTSLN